MKVIFQGMINMLILGKIKGGGGVAVYVTLTCNIFLDRVDSKS